MEIPINKQLNIREHVISISQELQFKEQTQTQTHKHKGVTTQSNNSEKQVVTFDSEREK